MTSEDTSPAGAPGDGVVTRAKEVRLRPVERDDLEVFFAYEQDQEAARRAVFKPRERERFMTHWENRVLGDPTGIIQTVIVDGENAGNIVSWEDGGHRLVGYWFGRSFWGRGIGTRALTQFLDLVPTRPLYADPFESNVASVRLLERCGFHRIAQPDSTHHLEPGQLLLMLER
ncbi:GNAT family N-acetyltransferase [Streptomyces zagrosensis]|uniref:RimJ/RimL family protein N-acetyltransferase n=1 Tax=Streptomyces zagrosensis TaxID=1042984 RepID=A0A7W9UXJ8_9ACTN|nr:GNAT family N-acetyltransferase [Streptomyces zagrosensis]MBB5934396.1 RimJ/RimL family protein N-acetyltransferase [Streptomyces zagrosensis]